ncbi:MAG: hypothetical protein WBK38_09130 [Bacteroidia bacterium]|jgi:hypothetical protein
MKKHRLLLIIIVLCVAQSSYAQKNILDKKNIVFVDAEIPDMIFDGYTVLKPSLKINLGIEHYLRNNKSISARFSHNKFVSSPWTKSSLNNMVSYYSDSTLSAEKIGYTKQNGFDISYKVYRDKTSALFPIGKYYEYGMGLHSTHFIGSSYQTEFYNSDTQRPELVPIVEEKTSVTTVSLAFGGGRQWLMENNLIVGFGYRFRLHIPVKFDYYGNESNYNTSYFEHSNDPKTLYFNDLLLTDWLSAFVKIGYIF